MTSLFDSLSEKLDQDPSLTKRGGPRADIGLLLLSERDSLNRLWKAADAYLKTRDDASLAELVESVETLKPVFGER
jgi:hypothetical protein